jgi:hypothetical protein
MPNRDRHRIDFEGMIKPSQKPLPNPATEGVRPVAPGDMADRYGDPSGFTAQTVNGTAHAWGTGWNRDRDWQNPQAESDDGPWQGGRSNRTGE